MGRDCRQCAAPIPDSALGPRKFCFACRPPVPPGSRGPDAPACLFCGGDILPDPTRRGPRKRFCNRKCQNANQSALKAAGVVLPPVREPCAVDGCARPGHPPHGMCGTHRARQKKHGSAVGPTPRQVANATARFLVCEVCTAGFQAPNAKTGTRQRFCSIRCRADARKTFATRAEERRATGQLRAKRVRAATSAPVKARDVFERDGWTCYLCLGPALRSDPSRRHPKAATLDHITPIAAGGLHALDNLACAHRGCNQRKHARPWFECAAIME